MIFDSCAQIRLVQQDMVTNTNVTKKRVKSNNLYLTFLHVNEFDLDTKKDTKLGIVKQKSGESCRYDDDYSLDGYGGG